MQTLIDPFELAGAPRGVAPTLIDIDMQLDIEIDAEDADEAEPPRRLRYWCSED